MNYAYIVRKYPIFFVSLHKAIIGDRNKKWFMEEIRKISKEQIVMAFVATCIETTARQSNTDYNEIYKRMERVGMKKNYIIPNYEPLHSESREVLADRMMECLKNWEEKL